MSVHSGEAELVYDTPIDAAAEQEDRTPLQTAYETALGMESEQERDAALSTVWLHTAEMVGRYCRSQLFIQEEADGAKQEAMLHIYDRFNRQDGRSNAPLDFLAAAITRHKIVDALRQRERLARELTVAEVEEVYDFVAAAKPDVADNVIHAESLARIGRLLLRLPPRQRQAVALTVLSDMTTDAAAETVGTSRGTIKVAKHRGLRRLAELWDVPDEHLPPVHDSV